MYIAPFHNCAYYAEMTIIFEIIPISPLQNHLTWKKSVIRRVTLPLFKGKR